MAGIIANERSNSLYNPHLKNRFLDSMIKNGDISFETSKSYRRILNITSSHEEILQKDLNKFSLEELEKILGGFKTKNKNTLETYARIMSSYFNWSISHKLTKSNPLASLKPTDFHKYLTDYEIYFSNKALQGYEDQCANKQDAVILRLLFIGVGGKQMSEIQNLSKHDIDRENNRLKLINTLKTGENGFPSKFTERYIDIDQRTMDLIEGALVQKTYIKRNGDMEHYNNIRPYTDLIENNYVVRASITRNDGWDLPVDRHVIYRRIKIIADSLGIDELTSKYIQRCGMIFYANKLIKDNEKLSTNDLKMIANRFNISSHNNLKGYLTNENIRNTYPE